MFSFTATKYRSCNTSISWYNRYKYLFESNTADMAGGAAYLQGSNEQSSAFTDTVL